MLHVIKQHIASSEASSIEVDCALYSESFFSNSSIIKTPFACNIVSFIISFIKSCFADGVYRHCFVLIHSIFCGKGGIIFSMERRDKKNYYLDLAEVVSQRSTCLRRHYGAVIVQNDEVISTGYVGAPRQRKNCTDLGVISFLNKCEISTTKKGKAFNFWRTILYARFLCIIRFTKMIILRFGYAEVSVLIFFLYLIKAIESTYKVICFPLNNF